MLELYLAISLCGLLLHQVESSISFTDYLDTMYETNNSIVDFESLVLFSLKNYFLFSKGVIFSLNYDAISRTIISTSDDRSLRTWGVDPDDLTTGNSKSSVRDVFERAKIKPKYEFYGHEARVWNSVVIRQSQDDPALIASLGEDSKICLWNLTTGNLFTKFDAHPGTSVWAADWDPQRNILVRLFINIFPACLFIFIEMSMHTGNSWRRWFYTNMEHQSSSRNE